MRAGRRECAERVEVDDNKGKDVNDGEEVSRLVPIYFNVYRVEGTRFISPPSRIPCKRPKDPGGREGGPVPLHC